MLDINKYAVGEKLFQKLKLVCVYLDSSLKVIAVTGDVANFGFDEFPIGSNISDSLDFMVGVDGQTELHWPVVIGSTGEPVSINLLPDRSGLILVIRDAESLHSDRAMLQQAANKNELLLNTQKKLTNQLEMAKQELEIKNQRLHESARLQNSFLSGVSHEFRTPLTSITGYSNLLNELLSTGDIDDLNKSKQYVSAIERSSKHLLSLVENLLDHGKLESEGIHINLKAVKAKDVFDDVEILLTPLATTKHIDLNFNINMDNDLILCMDDSRLRQCLINIIGNAIKFTDKGSVSIYADWFDDFLQVSVKDTGLGIKKSHLAKIIQPFWQAPNTVKTGTGLGLTITKRIIELMSGKLEIESKKNKGTAVHFSMPAPHIEAQEQVEQLLKRNNLQGISVLLVDDDRDINDLMALLLQEQGAEVTSVEGGSKAIEIVNCERFDLVLMDINMPIICGYEATAKIRQDGHDVPIVVMSASGLEANSARASEAGCDGFLLKPVDIVDVINVVEELVVG